MGFRDESVGINIAQVEVVQADTPAVRVPVKGVDVFFMNARLLYRNADVANTKPILRGKVRRSQTNGGEIFDQELVGVRSSVNDGRIEPGYPLGL